MEKIIDWLKSIGWGETELAYVTAHYAEMQEYLCYLRAVLDDRHEYVAEISAEPRWE